VQCIGYQGNTSPGELVGKDIALIFSLAECNRKGSVIFVLNESI